MRTLLISAAALGIATGLGAQTPTVAPPAKGWYLSIATGLNAWGDDSRVGGAMPLGDVSVGYETDAGIGFEYRIAWTEVTFPVLDNALGTYFFPRVGARRLPVGPFAQVGLGLRAGRATLPTVEDHGAWQYAYGLRVRAPGRARRRVGVFGEIGIATVRETYTEPRPWRDDGDVHWAVRHSGMRVRMGLLF